MMLRTTIRIALLFVLLNLFAGSVRADWPVFDRSMNGLMMDAMYEGKEFVGFKTACISDEFTLAKKIAKIYASYLDPFVKGSIEKNDTIVIISQYDSKRFGQGVESIYLHIGKNNIGVLRDCDSVLVECASDNYPGLFTEAPWKGDKRQLELCSTVFKWNWTKLINMFCISDMYGSPANNHNMNIYRIVKKNNEISEFVSISCNPETYWQYVPGLFYEMLSPDSQTIKWGAERAAFLNHKRPPETIEKTQLPR